MAIRNIRTDSDPILRKKSRKVEVFDQRLHTLLDDMLQTLRKIEGYGLAAVQVGVLKRAAVVDTGEKLIELINPEIISAEGEQRESEGCLSLPNRTGVTIRPFTVKIKAQDRNGAWHVYRAEELKARCFCHEIDHMDGVLFCDRLAPGETLTKVE